MFLPPGRRKQSTFFRCSFALTSYKPFDLYLTLACLSRRAVGHGLAFRSVFPSFPPFLFLLRVYEQYIS